MPFFLSHQVSVTLPVTPSVYNSPCHTSCTQSMSLPVTELIHSSCHARCLPLYITYLPLFLSHQESVTPSQNRYLLLPLTSVICHSLPHQVFAVLSLIPGVCHSPCQTRFLSFSLPQCTHEISSRRLHIITENLSSFTREKQLSKGGVTIRLIRQTPNGTHRERERWGGVKRA